MAIASFILTLEAIYSLFSGGSVPVLCWNDFFLPFLRCGRGPKPIGGGKIYKYGPADIRNAGKTYSTPRAALNEEMLGRQS